MILSVAMVQCKKGGYITRDNMTDIHYYEGTPWFNDLHLKLSSEDCNADDWQIYDTEEKE